MRLVIIGLDTLGRSKVERVEQVTPGSGPSPAELAVAEIWASTVGSPSITDRPRTLPLRPLTCPPGEVSWRMVWHPPLAHIGLHRTDTIDCDTVIEGGLDLELEEGRISLVAGDLVVIPGLVHGWRAGGDGCTVSAVLVGIPA